MTPRFHTLRIAEVRQETPDAISVRFAVPPELSRDYAFVHGQHVALRTRIGNAEVRRSYSICAGADDDLRVAIKKVPGGVFSNWAATTLRAGAAIDVLTPEGRFHTPLDPSQAKHYVAFAAGSGITPVLSLIKTTLKQEPRSRFTLLYGNRRQTGVMFHEELEDLKDRYLTRFTLHNLFSRESQDIDLFNGRLDGAKVKAFTDTLIPVESIDEAFICGPNAMIDEVETALRAGGLSAGRIHVERFGVPDGTPTAHAEAGDAPRARITVISDGVKREVEFREGDTSILDAALKAGVDLPYACKGGMCCTCRARLQAGRIRMERNFSLDARDVEAGYVLTCQSHPLTDAVTVNYDER
jgi:ring-1,2-phenylacetyl-CoA epoxidase subunit PaaE